MKISKKEDLKKIKKLLINIDMINGFIKKGSLAAPSIQRIIKENERLIEMFIEGKDSAVAFVEDQHTSQSIEFNVFSPHALKDTEESELIDEFKPYEKESLVYKKNSTNFVFAPNFIEDINNMNNLKVVVLTGCLTDFCVKNGGITLRNLFDQNDRDIVIILDKNGVDTFDAPNHRRDEINERSIRDMESNGIQIVKKLGSI